MKTKSIFYFLNLFRFFYRRYWNNTSDQIGEKFLIELWFSTRVSRNDNSIPIYLISNVRLYEPVIISQFEYEESLLNENSLTVYDLVGPSFIPNRSVILFCPGISLRNDTNK